MTRPAGALAAIAALALGVSGLAGAQTSVDAAKAEGKAFGRDRVAATQDAATTQPAADRLPNFGGVPGQSAYFGDPDRMSREAASQAAANPGYRTMRDSMDRRARFAPVDLDAAIARSKTINGDPLAYTSGMGLGGTAGRCRALPPSSGGGARYMATCNTGYTADQASRTCPITLRAAAEQVSDYLYYCPRRAPDCQAFVAPTCQFSGTHPGPCLQGYSEGNRFICTEPGEPIGEYTCSAPVTGQTPVRITVRDVIRTSRDESACAVLAGDSTCNLEAETCSDSAPVTRMIGGVAVTQPCWAWSRSYSCTRFSEAQDCAGLEATSGCKHVRDDCLSGEPCRTWERVYDCPVPDQPGKANQFICDGDIYCIDGACETIRREAGDEFKEAAVALNAMDQARREFDPDNLTLFRGTPNSCASKVFGVLNCCRGKGFALIPGIQLLVALGCSREEMLLHQRDAQGLCGYVGTYCASSFLGVCLTKRKVYCCFESKLSRILQEQGRQQLGKPWGNPKTEQCQGFTIDEFARLDLSRMDFSEVYAEFMGAARLPDELQAAADIQQKIEDYYARARR